jgi:hypothetical protein
MCNLHNLEKNVLYSFSAAVRGLYTTEERSSQMCLLFLVTASKSNGWRDNVATFGARKAH